MSPTAKTNDPVSQKYEIAEPIAYPVFAVPGTSQAALLQNVSKPLESGPFHEKWDDTGKVMPFLEKLNRPATPPEGEEKKAQLVGGKPVKRETRAVWIVHGIMEWGSKFPLKP
jgi:hypothetical protein